MKYLVLGFIVSILGSCSVINDRFVGSENTEATVMITNLIRTSGGSGLVLSSSGTHSEVLTNAHVCAVVKSGGLVTTTKGQTAFVSSYVTSKTHDLCRITVNSDLHARTRLAGRSPAKYEEATVSGHPHLLPNIVTKGHFSDKEIIPVMIGSRACTEDDYSNPTTGLFCIFGGRMPIVKNYEAIVVSATIMPGSSGSGIFNADHELSALVFAGAGDLGYAFAVPHEYIEFFLTSELNTLTSETPNTILQFTTGSPQDKSKFVIACNKATTSFERSTCEAVHNNTLFVK
jgi:hypothetical protein